MCWGFDLPPDVAFDLLMKYYNPRCEPPWSEAEMRHKVEDASQQKDYGKPRGYLLGDSPGYSGDSRDGVEKLSTAPAGWGPPAALPVVPT